MNMAERIANILAHARAFAAKWRRDQRGSVAVFLGVALVPLVAAIGIGVDSARGYLVRSRLSQSLDSAALAGGRVMFETYRDDDVRMYFTSNFPNGYLGATVGVPTITSDAANEVLTVTATATLPATFMQIFGQSQITVSASATINRTNRGMELVLVLDNTYSMATNNKMNSLKTAANDLLDILFGEDDTAPNLTVGIVPFVAMVNIGEERAAWTTARPNTQVTVTTLVHGPYIAGNLSNASNPRVYIACATVAAGHSFKNGQLVDIAGASPTVFNGRRQIRTNLWPGTCPQAANKFWYWIDNAGAATESATPATGTITARLPPETFTAGSGYTSTNGKWKGCVEQRFNPLSASYDAGDPFDVQNAEAPPTTRPFLKAFDPSSVGLRWYDIGANRFRFQCTTNTSTSGINRGTNDCDNNWAAGTIVENGAQTNAANNRGPNKGCAVPLMPLQPSRAAASTLIATMQPWNGGGTNIPTGFAWGWRMLSPNYRGIWGGNTPAAQPFDYNTALIDKVVVLLSDGANTALEGGLPGCNGSHGSYTCAPDESEYTGYGRVTGGGFNTTSLSAAPAQSDSRVTTLCTQMKAANKGIIIYTIMLEEPDPAIGAVFQACATKPEYYFQATSGNLSSIFKKIANQLSNLRLSQ